MSPQEQVERYRALLDTARCFGRAMDLPTLIPDILERAQSVMRAEACSIFLPDAQTGELIIHSTQTKHADVLKTVRIPSNAGIAGTVFQSHRRLNIKDVRHDPRHLAAVDQKTGFVTRAMIAIPLLEGTRCLGVMEVLNARDRGSFDEQDEELFEGFGGLIVNALIRLEAQQREVELAGSRHELQLAREIQTAFLPDPTQKFPFGNVRTQYFPAREVSGDFLVVRRVDAHRLLFGLGDVSGKGMPAALTMARLTAMIEISSESIGADLGEWVSRMNRQVTRDMKAGRFVGLTFLLADAKESSMQICAAGQFPPLHFDGGRWQRFEMKTQLPLGILPTCAYTADRVPLRRGDSWLLFSDGITEARNTTDEEFTEDRFLVSLASDPAAPRTLTAAVTAWKGFVQTAPQHDDASLLLLDWRGPSPSPEFHATCAPDQLVHGREFVEQWAAYAGYDHVTVGQIVTACDEAAANVLRHAYQQRTGPIHYAAKLDEQMLTIEIVDEASPIEPAQIKSRTLDDLRPGGLGTVIIAKVFDEVTYHPLPNGNRLTLRKRLPEDA
jgi:phosphoserine phosphatase RsbU/P